ncbi:hypothetical protein X943_002648 [Babesia divergens]|uniref:Sfi1 spindle body domain-containing protein n=1 Tax=Babesia divergens TaxID=32595 RepID=A0AAD9GDK7_BABDI|nr:hypothetical protein X943_002648 [Babesia divergens]
MVSTYHASSRFRKSRSVDKTPTKLQNCMSMPTTTLSNHSDSRHIIDGRLYWYDGVKPSCEGSAHCHRDLQGGPLHRRYSSPGHTQTTPKSAIKYVIRRNAFCKWAKSYHRSVRESVAHEIADLYYTKHHSETAFRALASAVRSRRIKEAKLEGDMFALRILLTRWYQIAVNAEAARCNAVSAAIFHQTSLAIRAFKAFKMEVQRRQDSRHYIYRLVELMEQWLLKRGLTPLRNHAEHARRMGFYAADIAYNHDRNIMNTAIVALNSAYRCHEASRQLEQLSKHAMLRQAWNHIISEHRSLAEKETLVEQAVRRETVVNVLDCWNYATKEKHASQYYDFILKYKSFSVFKRCREDRTHIVPPSPKTSAAEDQMTWKCKGTTTIKLAMSQKRNMIKAVGVVDRALQKCFKRAAMRALLENVKIIAAELLRDQQLTLFFEQSLAKRSFKAWLQYVEMRRSKTNMKLLGDLNYKTFLLSRAFATLWKCYTEKLEVFDAALTQFQNRQRLLHKRMYFAAFASGCNRSRALRVAQGVIENLHESQTRAAVLERFEGLSAQTLLHKLRCIASIANIDVQLSQEGARDILMTFRNIVFRKIHDGRGIFNTFMDRVLSPNIMATVTSPLRNECIVFLYYISGLKTRALELMKELELRPDDNVARLCNSLSQDELNELHSVYAYQLYVVRMEGFPSLNPRPTTTVSQSQSLMPLISNASATHSEGGHATGRSDSSSEDSVRSAKITGRSEALAEQAVPYTAYRTGNLEGIPQWLAALLHKLTLVKLCNSGDASAGSGGTFYRDSTAFDLLCYGLPLWRLILTKFLMKRSASAFRMWKEFTHAKKVRRNKMAELCGSLEGMSKMSVLMKSFKIWLDQAHIVSARRIAETNERCGIFTSILSVLVYRSVSIVFMRLHLRRIMFTHTGIARLQEMRKLTKAVTISCREEDSAAEIYGFRLYALMSKHFVGWRMHTQWNIEVTHKSSEFYRTIFLKKGWNALHNVFLSRRNRIEQLESSLDDGLRMWSIRYNFDAWYKAAKCRKTFATLNKPVHVVLGICFRRWKCHVRNKTRLVGVGETMQSDSDMRIMDHAFKALLEEFAKRRSLRDLSVRVDINHKTYLAQIAIQCWRVVARRRGVLANIHDQIRKYSDTMVQKNLLQTMHKFAALKQKKVIRLKSVVFGSMALYAASVKVTKMLDRRLALTEKDTCREFFSLQRSMKDDSDAYSKMIACKSPVYAALLELSKLKETRMYLGITALHQNVVYNTAIRKVQNLHQGRVLSSYFKSWRRWAAYNVRTSHGAPSTGNKNNADASNSGMSTGEGEELSLVMNVVPSEEEIDRYTLVLACFKHWRNSTIVLPGRNAAALIERFTTRNRQLDGLYLLKLHAMSVLWNRTCETRLGLLVDSMECKLKWSIFHRWKTLARQRMIDLYDDAHQLG